MKFPTLVMPHYLLSFRCIGSKCETSCCDEWNVVIDKTTYDKYIQIIDPSLTPLFLKHLKRNTENPSDSYYALMGQGENKHCVCKTSDNLCLIQQKYGPEYLSGTCNTYPRMINVINNELCEISGMISCPEIARLVLLNPAPICFQENETPDYFQNNFFIYKSINLHSAPYEWQRSVLLFRDFAVEILQERAYPLIDRLTFLGMFCQKIQGTIPDSPPVDFPTLITKYQKIFRNGGALNITSNITPNVTLQHSLLHEMCRLKTLDSPGYNQWLGDIMDGLGYSTQNSIEQNVENYRKTHLHYYQKYMAERDYVFENYLVNYLFSGVFPLSEDLFEAYITLIILYSLIKFHLIGMAGYEKGLDESLLVRSFGLFSRFIEHDPHYLSNLCALLKEKNLSNLAYMVILVKD